MTKEQEKAKTILEKLKAAGTLTDICLGGMVESILTDFIENRPWADKAFARKLVDYSEDVVWWIEAQEGKNYTGRVTSKS